MFSLLFLKDVCHVTPSCPQIVVFSVHDSPTCSNMGMKRFRNIPLLSLAAARKFVIRWGAGVTRVNKQVMSALPLVDRISE